MQRKGFERVTVQRRRPRCIFRGEGASLQRPPVGAQEGGFEGVEVRASLLLVRVRVDEAVDVCAIDEIVELLWM